MNTLPLESDPQLTEYARFLRQHHLSDVARTYLKLAYQEQMPLLRWAAHMPETELLHLTGQNWQQFLEQMAAGNTWEHFMEKVDQWKRDELPEGAFKDRITLADVVLANSLRKRVLVQYLPSYTSDAHQLVALVDELDRLYTELSRHFFEAFLSIEKDKLTKSQMLLAEAQAAAHVGSWEWNIKEDQVYWSDELYRIFGFEPNEFAINYQSYLQFQHPEDRAHIQKVVSEAIATRQSYSMEHRIIRKDGSIGWVLGKGRAILSTEGELLRLTGVSIDISGQKSAEQALQQANASLRETNEELVKTEELLREVNDELEQRVMERTHELRSAHQRIVQLLDREKAARREAEVSEHFLSSIIDQSPFSTWVADAQGTQIRVNAAFLKLFSIDGSKLQMGKYNLLRDEKIQDKPFFKQIQAVFSQGIIVRFERDYSPEEVHYVTAEAQPLHLITTIFPVKDEAGQVTHVVIQHEDITQRKRAEEALRAREAQLRLLTDSLPVLITYVDQEERYRFNNKTYEEWFGIPREEVYGRTLREVVGEAAYEKLKDPIRRALNGEPVNLEAELIYKVAGKRFVSVNYIPHFEQGRVLGYYALVTDISAQKNSQRALEEALQETSRKNQELNRINADLDNFVYTASHDLRSPITNLDGLQRVLIKKLQGKLAPVEQELMEHMSLSVAKLNQTIKDLTEIVKVQKEMDQPREPVFFSQLLEDVQQDIDPMIQEANAHVEAHFPVASIPYTRKHLRSILYNLLSNAIKYRSPDRPLHVKIRNWKEEGRIGLSVTDNGLGIAPEQLSKVFLMFKRLHTHVEGSGIGLYMVKRIIENNGGRITVESKQGQGTTFTVYFKEA